MRAKDLEPNTIYASDRQSYRNPDFFITGDPVITRERREVRVRYWTDTKEVNVVYVRAVTVDKDGVAHIGEEPVELRVLAQVSHKVGTLEDLEEVVRTRRARQRADAELRQLREQRASKLVTVLHEKGFKTAHARGHGVMVTDSDLIALGHWLGVDLDALPDEEA